jgi:hypothetical protein
METSGSQLTITPASSGDQAMNVILFLRCKLALRSSIVPCCLVCELLPHTLAGSQLIFDIVDGITGSLAHGTLIQRSVNTVSSTMRRIGRRGDNTYRLALGRGIDKLLAEVFPVLVVRGLVDDDLLVVVRELEDNVLVLLAKLQVVEGLDALLRNGSSAW